MHGRLPDEMTPSTSTTPMNATNETNATVPTAPGTPEPRSVLPSMRQRLAWAVFALAMVGGAALGFWFGARLGGFALGSLLALNGALFCSILAGAAVVRAGAWIRRQRRRG
jgi:hypothetical protein